jgi:hypothetical protein
MEALYRCKFDSSGDANDAINSTTRELGFGLAIHTKRPNASKLHAAASRAL